MNMSKNPFKNKAFRYLLCGGITAAFNILLIEAIISMQQLFTPIYLAPFIVVLFYLP